MLNLIYVLRNKFLCVHIKTHLEIFLTMPIYGILFGYVHRIINHLLQMYTRRQLASVCSLRVKTNNLLFNTFLYYNFYFEVFVQKFEFKFFKKYF